MLGLHNICRVLKTFSKRRQGFFLILFDVDHILIDLNIDTIGYLLYW